MKSKTQGLKSIRQLLDNYNLDQKPRYISREFQDYGYRLAMELDDLTNRSLYIKLAKEVPRPLLEAARNFVKDATKVRSKPRLFMWKLAQLRRQKKK